MTKYTMLAENDEDSLRPSPSLLAGALRPGKNATTIFIVLFISAISGLSGYLAGGGSVRRATPKLIECKSSLHFPVFKYSLLLLIFGSERESRLF